MVWYTLPTSLEQYQQASKRLHRSGQAHTVTVHYLLTEGTQDAYVLDTLLSGKAHTQDRLLKAIERMRNEENV